MRSWRLSGAPAPSSRASSRPFAGRLISAALGLGCGLGLSLASLGAHALGCRTATPAEAAVYTLPQLMPGVTSPRDGTCFIGGLKVPGSDGTLLSANVFLPRQDPNGAKAPGVMFISSWAAADFFEYVGQQQRLAQQGYVAFAYTARGFWGSEGTVGVAGPADVADASAMLDWISANTPADPQRLASAGISYGAGLSLLAAAKDSRIKAVVAMSGWAALIEQMYRNEVPNPIWLDILQLSGQLTGRLDPLVANYNSLLQNPDTPAAKISEIATWAWARSPSSGLPQLNARQVPVMLVKNWQDDMFSPNSSMALFAQLTGPKKLLLQSGIHASAELPGAVLGVDQHLWTQAQRWLARWLKGEANGIDTEPQVDLQPKFQGYRELLSTWPAPELTTQALYLQPRGAVRWDWRCVCTRGWTGGLGSAPSGDTVSDRIGNALDTTASSGPLPVLSPLMESVGLPVINHQATILWGNGIRYEGDWLRSPLKLRGIPSLQLRVKPSQARGMVVAYLYDVDAAGFGTLITHGARAWHQAQPGQAMNLGLDLVATAYDAPAGHYLALVLDTQDPLYGKPVRAGESFEFSLEFAPGQTQRLTLQSR